LKKVAALYDEIANQLNSLKKVQEELKESKEGQLLNDVIEEIKMKIKSQENRAQALQKNFRLLDEKVCGMALLPNQNDINIDSSPIENKNSKLDNFVNEFNGKLSTIRDSVSLIKIDINNYMSTIDSKIMNKVNKDDLIEMENHIYKDIDTIISGITRKISTKTEKYLFDDLNTKFKKHLKRNITLQGEILEDAMAAKKPLSPPLSCLSCERQVTQGNMKNDLYIYSEYKKPNNYSINKQKGNVSYSKLAIHNSTDKKPGLLYSPIVSIKVRDDKQKVSAFKPTLNEEKHIIYEKK